MSASIIFTILFAGVTLLHIAQAIFYRTWYSWMIVGPGALQVATYIFRHLSIREPDSETYYVLWFVLILVASVWTNAYVYMIFGRMVWRYQPNSMVPKLKALVGGAVMAAHPGAKIEDVMRGLHTSMRAKVEFSSPILMVWVLLAALLFITASAASPFGRKNINDCGLHSSILNQEGWQYGLDPLPMLLALFLFNLFHPGRIMPADETLLRAKAPGHEVPFL